MKIQLINCVDCDDADFVQFPLTGHACDVCKNNEAVVATGSLLTAYLCGPCVYNLQEKLS